MTDTRERRQREVRKPVAMSPAEKLAAEEEARHDVAARGHTASPRVVQQYLSRARAAEELARRHDD